MPSIIHFEIRVGNVERAVRFYRDVFGWQIEKWSGPEGAPEYYMVKTKGRDEPGIDGGLMMRDGASPQGNEPIRTFVCTIGVDSADGYAEKIKAAGGKISTPKMPITGTGWMFYAEDTEGNSFGIMQPDETAR